MKFTKMQALGNDYLYVRAEKLPDDAAELARRFSPRRFGAGGDGIIWILPSEKADAEMRIFNADGSEAKMCGNGIRCVGKYLYDRGIARKGVLRIDTLSGVKTLTLEISDGVCTGAAVEMGKAEVGEEETVEAEGETLTLTPVSVGNPHAVILWPDAEKAPLGTLGKALQTHPRFPDGVNAEFVTPLSPTRIRMRVWERGSGVTLACGTGASASVAALVKKGLCPENTPVTVVADGGELRIRVSEDGAVVMAGPAETVYEGEIRC